MKKNLPFILSAFFFLCGSFQIHAQIITTIAGNGINGYSGDGGPATLAEISSANGIAIDASGNIYITDAKNNFVRKINTLGIISTIAGNGTVGCNGDGGPATDAQLWEPSGITVDDNGNVYITESGNCCSIRKISISGIITTIAGKGGCAYEGDGGLATATTLYDPSGVVVDKNGNLYIADENNYRIRKVDAFGLISTFAGNGNYGFSGDGGAATSAEIAPYFIAIDKYGDVLFTDGYRVRKIDTTGIINTIAGGGSTWLGDGGPANAAYLFELGGISTDINGNIYIADGPSNRIREVNAIGIINTVAGGGTLGLGDGGPAISAEIKPSSITVDSIANMYISDEGNNRIRKVWALSTGISILNISQSTKIYPNPTTGSFNLSLFSPTNEAAQITITNMVGEKVKKLMIPTNKETRLQLSAPPGMYFITATTAHGTQYAKIMVQ